jgi:uncharacterized protein HemY
MIAFVTGLAGIFYGIWTAKKRGGNRMDMAQYGFGFGVAFFLITYLLLLILSAFY